jgi:hypothetical protein
MLPPSPRQPPVAAPVADQRSNLYAACALWARVHKIDRIRPLPNGGAIVLIEDERTSAAIDRVPPLSTLIAVARVLNARRALDAKYGGKGEIRYATAALPPAFLTDALTRAGAAVAEADGETVVLPPMRGAIAPVIDDAFSKLAHHIRTSTSNQALDIATALKQLEGRYRRQPLDRDKNPVGYWTAVFELAALAGELSRAKKGFWIDTTDMPVPFAIRVGANELARPFKLAQRIVEGAAIEEGSLSEPPPAHAPASAPEPVADPILDPTPDPTGEPPTDQ